MSKVFGFGGTDYDAVRVIEIGASLDVGEAPPPTATLIETGMRQRHMVLRAVDVHPNDAILLLALWNALPEDIESRCHFPMHGIQLISDGKTMLTVAICFQCNNASLGGPEATDRWRTFAADGPDGRRLRAMLDRLLFTGS